MAWFVSPRNHTAAVILLINNAVWIANQYLRQGTEIFERLPKGKTGYAITLEGTFDITLERLFELSDEVVTLQMQRRGAHLDGER